MITMITSEQESRGMRERIAYFARLLRQLCATATPEEFRMMASGYGAELERVQAELVGYLTRPLDTEERAVAA